MVPEGLRGQAVPPQYWEGRAVRGLVVMVTMAADSSGYSENPTVVENLQCMAKGKFDKINYSPLPTESRFRRIILKRKANSKYTPLRLTFNTTLIT